MHSDNRLGEFLRARREVARPEDFGLPEPGRRRTPGRPVTFGTTPAFLDHFGLEAIGDLPGLGDLKAAGMMEATPSAADLPEPDDDPRLREDEDPLEFDFRLEDAELEEGAGAESPAAI